MTATTRRPSGPAGSLDFGRHNAPSHMATVEQAAWSGGYWARTRHRTLNPFRRHDRRWDAWELGWQEADNA